MENGIDVLAELDKLLAPQEFEITPFIFVIRPMKRIEWGEALRALPVLPSGEKVKESEAMIVKRETMYAKVYEMFVLGVKSGDEIVKVPIEKLTAGMVEQLGERVVEISGLGGSKVAAAGRSL